MITKEKLRGVFAEALKTVIPGNMIRETVRLAADELIVGRHRYPLGPHQRIYVFGSGKAAIEMAKPLEEILGERLAGGLVVANYAENFSSRIESIASSHPVLTEKSVAAAERLSRELGRLEENDLFIYLLSGGNSALVEKPVAPITLAEMQEMIRLLLAGGVPIEEMNMVRKHLSTVKGGRLGQFTRASGAVLVLSDVIGDDMEAIGSAPLYRDSSTWEDVAAILEKYGLTQEVPETISRVISQGLAGAIEETPKKPSDRIHHLLVGSNGKILARAAALIEGLGCRAEVMTASLRGEAREVAKVIVSLGEEIRRTGRPFSPPVCLIFGGETTVTVKGKGRGGRNQEMCLALLKELRDQNNYVFLSAGTDGIDGASEAAGAVVDAQSHKAAEKLGLRYDPFLNANNSNEFLQKTGDLIVTGPTGTNVMDISILAITGKE